MTQIPDWLRGRSVSYWEDYDAIHILPPEGEPVHEGGVVEDWWSDIFELTRREIIIASLMTNVRHRTKLKHNTSVFPNGEIMVLKQRSRYA